MNKKIVESHYWLYSIFGRVQELLCQEDSIVEAGEWGKKI